MGITPEKIATHANLLGRDPNSIQKNYYKLIELGITPKKINTIIGLLVMNPDTIQDRYNKLIELGITSEKINTYAILLVMNPDTISNRLRYLVDILRFEENIIQKLPIILTENLDAFAIKIRSLKISILELKRIDKFNPNNYYGFYLFSPATILAKKYYCVKHKICLQKSISSLSRSWKKIMERKGNKITREKATQLGRHLTKPFKVRYDTWMKEYKKWAKDFAERRGRRVINKI